MNDTSASSATASAPGPSVGDPLPELLLRHLDGRELDLLTYHGKRLLLFFWASW